jgi:hypothetical protein
MAGTRWVHSRPMALRIPAAGRGPCRSAGSWCLRSVRGSLAGVWRCGRGRSGRSSMLTVIHRPPCRAGRHLGLVPLAQTSPAPRPNQPLPAKARQHNEVLLEYEPFTTPRRPARGPGGGPPEPRWTPSARSTGRAGAHTTAPTGSRGTALDDAMAPAPSGQGPGLLT